MIKIIKDKLREFHWVYIRPLKNFISWGKAFKDTIDSSIYGDLFKFVKIRTDKFIEASYSRDTHYVKGDKYVRIAKILNRLSNDLLEDIDGFEVKTMFDDRIKVLEGYWWDFYPQQKEDFLAMAYRTSEVTSDKGYLYTPVLSPCGKEYFKLQSLQYKQQSRVIKERLRLFHEYLKRFDSLCY